MPERGHKRYWYTKHANTRPETTCSHPRAGSLALKDLLFCLPSSSVARLRGPRLTAISLELFLNLEVLEYRWYEKAPYTREARGGRKELIPGPGAFSWLVLHATSVDEIAFEFATPRAGLFNFESKEDLFFAVYEQRADRVAADYAQALPGGRTHRREQAYRSPRRCSTQARRRVVGGLLRVLGARGAPTPTYRRFAKIHARFTRADSPPSGVERWVEECGIELPVDAGATQRLCVMMLGLSLERLTQPEVVDLTLGPRMVRFAFEGPGRPRRYCARREKEER